MTIQARLRTSPVAGILAYYAAVGVVLVILARAFPWLSHMLALDFSEALPAAEQFRGAVERPDMPVPALGPLINTALLVLFAMAGSLVFALPVAWTYTATKGHEGYDTSVVQMIVVLPIAVAGVVLIVRGSVALAFALAGIVAAVRFRTTLKDVKDAVFAFVAIGIGLAAGVQSWIIAGVLSLVFCLVIAELWRFETSAKRRAFALPAGPVTLAEALAPDRGARAVTVGEPAMVAPLTADERLRVEERAARLHHLVRADAMAGTRRFKHLLLIHAADRQAAEEALDDLLEDYAKRWRLADVFPGRSGTWALEYLVRFKKKANVTDLVELLADSPVVRGAELTSIQGLRDLVT